MERAPPFLHKFGWNPRVEVEIAVKATPIFDVNFIGRHDTSDPRYVRVIFGPWALRTDSRHQISKDKTTKCFFIEAAKPLIHRFILDPPLMDVQPGFIGYLSQPPSATFSLKTYAVWCSAPDNYALRRVLNGPLMNANQRFKVRTIKGLRDRLPASALEWFHRFGVHMDPGFQGGMPARDELIKAWATVKIKPEAKDDYVPRCREYVEDTLVPDDMFPGTIKREVKDEDEDEADWSRKMFPVSVPSSLPLPPSPSSTTGVTLPSTPSLSYRPPTPFPPEFPSDSEGESEDVVAALASVEALITE